MPTALRVLSNVCLVAGFVSILASILVWAFFRDPDAAHGERFGIFVGLWAPTFFILSDRFGRPPAHSRPAGAISPPTSPDTQS